MVPAFYRGQCRSDDQNWRITEDKIMKLLGILMCIIIFIGICAAEETEYFDWKGSQLYAGKNYTDALAYFNQAVAQDPNSKK